MISVAVISDSNFSFDNISYNDIISDKFAQMLCNYIKIIQLPTENGEIMKHIIPLMDCPDNTECRSYKCYESQKHSSFLLYATRKPTEDKSETTTNADVCNVNILGKFLSERHEDVLGKCVIVNSTDKNIYDVSYQQVVDIIRSRVVHKAVIVTPNDDVNEIIYTNLPIENSPLHEDNCRCIQVEFLNRIICIFLEHNPATDKFNKYATLICKRLKVHGNVVISMMTQYPFTELTDLTPEVFKKILCIRSNTSSSDVNGLSEKALQTNFYDVLEENMQKFHSEICETIPDDVINGQTMNSSL